MAHEAIGLSAPARSTRTVKRRERERSRCRMSRPPFVYQVMRNGGLLRRFEEKPRGTEELRWTSTP